MRYLKDNGGYSLLEMVITIALIGIAIGTSSFGLSVIYNSNVNSHASEIVNEIRLAQTKQMAGSYDEVSMVQETVDLKIDHDGTRYILKMIVNSDETNPLKSIEMPRNLSIKKDMSGTYQELSSITEDPSMTLKEKTFRFEPSSGKVLSSAEGRYRVGAANSTVEVDFTVVKRNGRVYIEE